MKRLVYLLALVLPMAAWAQGSGKDAKPAKPPAGVNWEGQVIRATGSGAPDVKASTKAQARLGAEKAAQMDAFRNLLQQVKGIRISAGQTMGEAMGKDEIRGKVEGVIRGYKVVDKRYYSDMGVEVDVEVPLAALTEVVAETTEAQVALKTEGEAKNTGLVVDARGLSVTPALAPRLLDEAGKLLYGVDCLSAEARRTAAAVAYVKTLDEAKKSGKVGDKPLVVKATKVEGTDLILSATEAKKLAEANNAYLAEGRVVIVANQSP